MFLVMTWLMGPWARCLAELDTELVLSGTCGLNVERRDPKTGCEVAMFVIIFCRLFLELVVYTTGEDRGLDDDADTK